MKEVLRQKMLTRRRIIPKSYILKKSAKIKKRLFEMIEFDKAQTILFYVSYDNEVFTHDMIKESISIGKRVIVPVSNKENRRLILSDLIKWEYLKPGSYGILEPIKEKIQEVDLNTIDIIVLPGVAFDKQGHRIGHGKGYYDRLLINSKTAIHVGLAFEFQLIDKIPIEDHDIKIDKIITEERTISCSNAM